MRQTKLARSLVNFRAHYKIVLLYFYTREFICSACKKPVTV